MFKNYLLNLLAFILLGLNVRAEESIKIVSSLPRTGSATASTNGMVNGIKLAIEEVGGKIGDFNISYEDWDDASPERGQWDPAIEASNADRAVRDSDIVAYIGTYNSGAAKISMPKLNAGGVLMVSPANTWPGLTKPGVGEANEPMVYQPSGKVTYFRVAVADDIQGKMAARWTKKLGANKVYLLHDGELYGKGIALMYQKSSKDAGLQILNMEQVDPKASNYRSLAIKIKQQNPDLVYYGGTSQTNAGQIAKDLKAVGVKAKFMVPDGCFEKAFIDGGGAQNLNGTTYVTFGGIPSDQLTGVGKKFYENYKTKYGNEPEGYAVYSYESTKVVLEAIKKVGKKDRSAIITAVAATKDFDGALGKWSFDANGDTTLQTMSGYVVENGDFKFSGILE